MGVHGQPIVSTQTPPSSRAYGYILTKVSKSKTQYFYTGAETLIEVEGGGHALVAATSLFIGDAHAFPDVTSATAYRNTLNRQGIGGAEWKIGPAHQFNRWGRRCE